MKKCIAILSNIGDRENLQVLVATTQAKVGKPDILVCNAAGEAPIGSLEKVAATVSDEAMISNVQNNLGQTQQSCHQPPFRSQQRQPSVHVKVEPRPYGFTCSHTGGVSAA